MHPIKNYYFFVGSFLYLMIQLTRRLSIKTPSFINSYLTDFLFIPLLLLLTIWLIRLIKRDENLILSISMLIFNWIVVSIVFEYYLPQKNSLYIGDKLDVLMYFLGTICFYFLQNKIVQKKLPKN